MDHGNNSNSVQASHVPLWRDKRAMFLCRRLDRSPVLQPGRNHLRALWFRVFTRILRHQTPKTIVFFSPRANPAPPHTQALTRPAQMHQDLDSLNKTYLNSLWRAEGHPEPCIGDKDCPILAEGYGQRGRSCYSVFIYTRNDNRYGCLHDRCYQDGSPRGPAFRTVDEAIRHQRNQHF